jgi:hypothetical protein
MSERCRRVYGVAFDSMFEAYGLEYTAYSPHPYKVLEQLLWELRGYEHWPVDT